MFGNLPVKWITAKASQKGLIELDGAFNKTRPPALCKTCHGTSLREITFFRLDLRCQPLRTLFNQMVELSAGSLDDTFYALSHPVRRQILSQLLLGMPAVTELAKSFQLSLNGVSKHIKALERAGLVRRDIQGRVHRLCIETQPLTEAAEAIEFYREFWQGRLDALADYLESQPNNDTQTHDNTD